MSDTETTQQALEHTHHATEHPTDQHARRAALLIGILAAALALGDMQEKQAQNAYLARHIAVSDTWAFYQAKRTRADISGGVATVLESLPGAAGDPEIQKRIAEARAEAQRLRSEPGRDGAKELSERARQETELREASLHRYHRFELGNGALQIAIVLASVSVVTRVRVLVGLAAALGAAAVAVEALVAWGLL
jgi:hypothetical protein